MPDGALRRRARRAHRAPLERPLGGLAELHRVAGRQVVLHVGPERAQHVLVHRATTPRADRLDDDFFTLDPTRAARPGRVEVVPVPHDCHDGFFAAYWRRPEAYFDPDGPREHLGVPPGGPAGDREALGRLRADLDSGGWHRRNAELLDRDELDLGYRLIVAGPSATRRSP